MINLLNRRWFTSKWLHKYLLQLSLVNKAARYPFSFLLWLWNYSNYNNIKINCCFKMCSLCCSFLKAISFLELGRIFSLCVVKGLRGHLGDEMCFSGKNAGFEVREPGFRSWLCHLLLSTGRSLPLKMQRSPSWAENRKVLLGGKSDTSAEVLRYKVQRSPQPRKGRGGLCLKTTKGRFGRGWQKEWTVFPRNRWDAEVRCFAGTVDLKVGLGQFSGRGTAHQNQTTNTSNGIWEWNDT